MIDTKCTGEEDPSSFYDKKVHTIYYPLNPDRRVPSRYGLIGPELRKRLDDGTGGVLCIGVESLSELKFLARYGGIALDKISVLDVSKESVAMLRRGGVAADRADVSTEVMPFESGRFRCIVMSEVIEHLLDPDHALSECHRVLAPNGALILTTPNLAAWFNRFSLMLGFQPMFTETGLEVVEGRGPFVADSRPVGHIHVLTLAALRRMLARNGFLVATELGVPYEGGMLPGALVTRFDKLAARIPSIAAGLFVVGLARKTPPEVQR